MGIKDISLRTYFNNLRKNGYFWDVGQLFVILAKEIHDIRQMITRIRRGIGHRRVVLEVAGAWEAYEVKELFIFYHELVMKKEGKLRLRLVEYGLRPAAQESLKQLFTRVWPTVSRRLIYEMAITGLFDTQRPAAERPEQILGNNADNVLKTLPAIEVLDVRFDLPPKLVQQLESGTAGAESQ